jgi:hypothetical protein
VSYNNSAYRYAGEDYPAKSLDFALAPSLDSSCFGIKCSWGAKILGTQDLHSEGRYETNGLQFGLKIPGAKWADYWMPGYSMTVFLPTTTKEINVDRFQYGVGGSFSLGTTPELMGGDFVGLKGVVSLRKNIHENSSGKLQNWVSRQALTSALKFTDSFSAELVFGHIYGLSYDRTENEIIELSQSVSWTPVDWLELSLGHSNNGPMFNDAGDRMDTSLVSIDNSVISFGFGISNSF